MELTVKEAFDNALEFLESLGYTSGDIHDDFKLAINRVNAKAAQVMDSEL